MNFFCKNENICQNFYFSNRTHYLLTLICRNNYYNYYWFISTVNACNETGIDIMRTIVILNTFLVNCNDKKACNIVLYLTNSKKVVNKEESAVS